MCIIVNISAMILTSIKECCLIELDYLISLLMIYKKFTAVFVG